MFVLVFVKVLPLLLAILLGYVAGLLRVFSAPADAVDILNRYALYFGFPLLLFQGFCRPSLQLSGNPGFYVFHLLVAGLIVGCIVLMGKCSFSLHRARGGLVLGTLFGNVAYLGIPLSTQLLGVGQSGLISLSVALQVFLAMSLGPLCLLFWSVGEGAKRVSPRAVFSRLLRQPLLWAPVLGFAARLLPPSWMQPVLSPLSFFAASAAPVALFLLGLHIWIHQSSLRQLEPAVLGLLVGKLVLVPALVVLVGAGFVQLGWMSAREWRVTLILSMMPTAITTFSIARDFREREGLMAQAILLSTLLALLLLPLLAPVLLAGHLAS